MIAGPRIRPNTRNLSEIGGVKDKTPANARVRMVARGERRVVRVDAVGVEVALEERGDAQHGLPPEVDGRRAPLDELAWADAERQKGRPL